MSGGFRDSFTKEDTKEDVLGYDTTAFYYFVISVLTCVAVPWTLSVIYSAIFPGKAQVEKEFPRKNAAGSTFRYCQTSEMVEKVGEARKAARRCTAGSATWFLLKSVILTTIWAGIFGTVMQLGQEKEIKKFDPFDILDVPPHAANPQIKRAYRKLSLTYHPDKNPDDPLAASRFIQITKAYQALTDDVAKRNWEKYGNPDGPQTTKVGIGLPRFLLEKEHSLMILCAFFFVLIIVVPMTFICYFQQTKNFAANGVLIDTLQFLGYYVSESTRVKNGPELFAACAESRQMATRPTDNTHIQQLASHVVEHKKRVFSLPVIMKNQFILWAHMQRRHHLMSAALRKDLDELLRHSMKVTQAMIEVACMREWFATAQAMIEFRRCLVQALDVKSSQLLQVPHVTDELVEDCRNAARPVLTLAEFLATDAAERKALLKMEGQKLADVEAFCAHIAEVELKAIIAVEDEAEIVVGDVATVSLQMVRKHLRENEAIGPIHAPFFPEPKFEEWWFFLVEAAPATRIVHFERILDTERVVQEKLRFQVTRPGPNNLVLHALCDSYAGLDVKIELNFNAHAEEEFKREFPVHEEDEELDLQPTLFQQWMGDLGHEEESEEEEDEGDGDKSPAKSATSAEDKSREKGSPARSCKGGRSKEPEHKEDSAKGNDSDESSTESDDSEAG